MVQSSSSRNTNTLSVSNSAPKQQQWSTSISRQLNDHKRINQQQTRTDMIPIKGCHWHCHTLRDFHVLLLVPLSQRLPKNTKSLVTPRWTVNSNRRFEEYQHVHLHGKAVSTAGRSSNIAANLLFQKQPKATQDLLHRLMWCGPLRQNSVCLRPTWNSVN